MAYQSGKLLPRYRCFSLGDFREFEKCELSFFVKHHLQQKYDLEEGSENKALGTLLDLTIKKIHSARAYNLPPESVMFIVKAAEREMREKAQKEGSRSYHGPNVEYLSQELVEKAQNILKNFYQSLNGKINPSLSKNTFWDYEVAASDGEILKFWGGPDALEMGTDGVPEIVDYKYFEDQEKGKGYLDMDLMPKLYVLLCALELKKMGYKKARFKIRSWQDPRDDSLYEEFDLEAAKSLEEFFKEKAEKILRVEGCSSCNKDYCKVCRSDQKEVWLKMIDAKSWLDGK
jgi:hypothetical protein